MAVENNSSSTINAVFSFTSKPESYYSGITGTFACTGLAFNSLNNTLALPVAAENTEATIYTVTFTPSGELPSNISALVNYTEIGLITITLAEAA